MSNANELHQTHYSCNTIKNHTKGSDHKVRKFKIPSVPPTTSKTIRFPNDVIAQVEAAIQGRDCTFTAFVIEAVRVALDSLEEEEE